MVGGRKEPFDGVVLGPLLGKGSFGRVYRALWDGQPVAVKARHAAGLAPGTHPATDHIACLDSRLVLNRRITTF